MFIGFRAYFFELKITYFLMGGVQVQMIILNLSLDLSLNLNLNLKYLVGTWQRAVGKRLV